MAKIESFKINHNQHKPGIYLQEVKRGVLIYDLRFLHPNMGDYMSCAVMHSIEHLCATYFKTQPNLFSGDVISFCPGACGTMFYLEIFNMMGEEATTVHLKREFIKCIDWCLKRRKVPGATQEECGNYECHNLLLAQLYLKNFKEVLQHE